MGLGGPNVPDRQVSLIDGSVSRGLANLEPGTGTRGEGQQQLQQQQQQQQQQEEVEDKTPKKPNLYCDGSLKQNKCYFWQAGGAGVYWPGKSIHQITKDEAIYTKYGQRSEALLRAAFLVSVQLAPEWFHKDGASSSDCSNIATGAGAYWDRQCCSGWQGEPDNKVL